MSNIYADQSINAADMAIEMAMSLAGTPAELRDDPPVCSNVTHIQSLVPSVAALPIEAIHLLGDDIINTIYAPHRQGTTPNTEQVSFYALARAFVDAVGVDNTTVGLHTLSAYQTLMSDGLLDGMEPALMAASKDVTKAVIGKPGSGYEFYQGESFFGGTKKTTYRTADHVLPALSTLYAAGAIGTHRGIDPQTAVLLSTLPGPAGFYHVYRVVYRGGNVRIVDASVWQFTLAPVVLALVAAVFSQGAFGVVDSIIDEVERGVFTSGFSAERPDIHFTAMRERAEALMQYCS